MFEQLMRAAQPSPVGHGARGVHLRAVERTPKKFKVGQNVGEWRLIEYRPGRKVPTRTYGAWHCRCTCGAERWVLAGNLNSGSSTSCGHDAPRGSRPPNPDKVIRRA